MESNALGTWLLLLSLHTICQCWNIFAKKRFVIRFRRVFQEALKVQIAFRVKDAFFFSQNLLCLGYQLQFWIYSLTN